MRVTKIQIEGFGRLVDRTFHLSPGLSLFFGPNEAGKSTLQQAVLALLCGFPARSPGPEMLDAYKPWDVAASYGGSLTYFLDDGRAYRVSRTFAPRASTTLHTHPEGTDVSAQLAPGGGGILSPLEGQLGLSREVFEKVCVVRQAELAALEGSAAAITDALKRFLASASMDASATDALDLLDAALRAQVGAEEGDSRRSAHARRSASAPLSEATDKLARLEEEREASRQGRQEAASERAALQQVAQRVADLDRQRKRLQVLQYKAERNSARVQLAATGEASAEVSRCQEEVARWRDWADFPVELREAALKLSAQRSHLQEEYAEAEQRARQAQETLHALAGHEVTLKGHLAVPEEPEQAPEDTPPDIQALADEWRIGGDLMRVVDERCRMLRSTAEARERTIAEEGRQLEPVLPMGPTGLAAIQKRLRAAGEQLAQAKSSLTQANSDWVRAGLSEAQYQQLEIAVQGAGGLEGTPRRGCLGFLGIGGGEEAGGGSSEYAIYTQVRPLYEALVANQAEAEAAQRALSDAEAATLWQLGRLMGGTLEDSSFEQLTDRLGRHLQVVVELEEEKLAISKVQADLEQTRTRHEAAQTALTTELGRLGFDVSDLPRAVEAYLKGAEGRPRQAPKPKGRAREQARAEADLERLRVRSEALQAQVRAVAERQAALAVCEDQLAALLGRAGIGCTRDTLDGAFDSFNQGLKKHLAWEKATAALEAATRLERSLLDSQAGSVPQARLRELDTILSTPRGEDAAWSVAEPDRPPSEYAAQLERLEDERAAARDEHDRLQARLQEATGALRHPAEVEEEIAAARRDVRRLERFRDALHLAHDELARANEDFQRQSAPRLEALMNEGLGRITQGRYTSVTVDPETLAIAVTAPERGAQVPVQRLSTGTRDLIYLLLRTSIARLLSRGEKLPLLLDDPLVQCDRNRHEQALRYLVQLAEDTQVLFFTKDDQTRDWFEEQAGSTALQQIHILS